MIPSALSLAKSDKRLRGAPLAVYVWCLESLDAYEYRPVKIVALAHELHMAKETAIFALRRLCAAGYIARGDRPNGEARHYRVYAAPVKAKAA
jgi:predicted transcriptional regulator